MNILLKAFSGGVGAVSRYALNGIVYIILTFSLTIVATYIGLMVFSK
tara:strand:+ start:58 stop:198 length:141 start_codon:yes stop_codon:yes gene_type:complete